MTSAVSELLEENAACGLEDGVMNGNAGLRVEDEEEIKISVADALIDASSGELEQDAVLDADRDGA